MAKTWFGWLVVAALVLVGVLAVGFGIDREGTPKAAAPLPPAHVPVNRITPAAKPDAMGDNELSIPSLGVKASVVPVRLANHELGVPGDVRVVGEYDQGAAPTALEGTTLLDGHVNWYNQGPGALAGLASIHINAPIYLTDDAGKVTAWRVVSVRGVTKASLPQDIFASTGPRQLALVTCGGALLSTGHYEDNVVVIAVPAAGT